MTRPSLNSRPSRFVLGLAFAILLLGLSHRDIKTLLVASGKSNASFPSLSTWHRHVQFYSLTYQYPFSAADTTNPSSSRARSVQAWFNFLTPSAGSSLEQTIHPPTTTPGGGGDDDDPPAQHEDGSDDVITDVSPYDMVLGLSHHKTGTFQLRCLLKAISTASSLVEPVGSCFKDHSVNAADLSKCYERQKSSTHPILYKTFHGVKQLCNPFDAPSTTNSTTTKTTKTGADTDKTTTLQPNTAWEPCLSFMVRKPCNETTVAWMTKEVDCSLDLPPGIRFGFFNIIRNPIDSVISAFSFHVQRPKSEPWLFRPYKVSSLEEKLRWAGAEEETIKKLKLGAGYHGDEVTYPDLLTRIPPEDGVILEFWHSLPELVSVARQYSILLGHEGAFQPRFEDLRDRYNETLLEGLRHLRFPSVSPIQVLETSLAEGCDPGAWTEEQRAANVHVTTGKNEDVKGAAEVALMSYPPAKKILCQLTVEMSYRDERCGMGDGNDAEW